MCYEFENLVDCMYVNALDERLFAQHCICFAAAGLSIGETSDFTPSESVLEKRLNLMTVYFLISGMLRISRIEVKFVQLSVVSEVNPLPMFLKDNLPSHSFEDVLVAPVDFLVVKRPFANDYSNARHLNSIKF